MALLTPDSSASPVLAHFLLSRARVELHRPGMPHASAPKQLTVRRFSTWKARVWRTKRREPRGGRQARRPTQALSRLPRRGRGRLSTQGPTQYDNSAIRATLMPCRVCWPISHRQGTMKRGRPAYTCAFIQDSRPSFVGRSLQVVAAVYRHFTYK